MRALGILCYTGAMEYYRYLPEFVDGAELVRLQSAVAQQREQLRETRGYGGLGPRCTTMRGDAVRTHLPELVTFGEQRVRPEVERFVGGPIQAAPVVEQAVRVQSFTTARHSFRWHFDLWSYAALLTLTNTNGGQTQVAAPQLRRVLRYLFYPLYWLPAVFSLLPRDCFCVPPGGLLILSGAEVLHRGVTVVPEGDRTVVVYAYDHIGSRANPLRSRIAQLLNTPRRARGASEPN